MYELVLDGPGKNALSSAMLQSIHTRLDANEGQPLLLRGENGALSAGVDLKEIAALEQDGMRAYLELLDDVSRRLFEWTAPTVAVIDGHAIAGGSVLALACDVRIASDNPKLKIGLTEVAVGVLFPPMIWNLVNLRIPNHAKGRVLLGAALVGPAKAKELGLVDEVVPDALAAGRAELERRARFAPDVYAGTKAMLQQGVLDLAPEQVQAFADEVVPAWTSPELRARLLKALAR